MTPEQNLLKFARTGDKEALHAAAQEISQRIAAAINPVNPLTAPLVIHVLNLYAASIDNLFDGAANAAKGFDELPSMVFSIPTKRKNEIHPE